jgi:membrane protein YqaA with SNARE-associated domain
MNLNEKYVLVFTDTLYSNLILSTQEDFAFAAMYKFGHHTTFLWEVTILATLCAGAVNYALGKTAYNMFLKAANQDTTDRYYAIQSIWRKFYLLPFALCLVPSLSKFIILFCGVVNFKFLRSLLLLLIFKYVYYLTQVVSLKSYISFLQ